MTQFSEGSQNAKFFLRGEMDVFWNQTIINNNNITIIYVLKKLKYTAKVYLNIHFFLENYMSCLYLALLMIATLFVRLD